MKPIPTIPNVAFIEEGLIEIFGQDLTALHSGIGTSNSTLFSLKEFALRQLGQAETKGMYIRAGRAAFYYWLRQHAESLGWLEVEFRLLPGHVRINKALLDVLKWFDAQNILKGSLASTEDAWLISVTGLVGDDAYLECNTFIGMVQELACWAGGGKFYPAHESQCQADAAEHCLFEITKLPVG